MSLANFIDLIVIYFIAYIFIAGDMVLGYMGYSYEEIESMNSLPYFLIWIWLGAMIWLAFLVLTHLIKLPLLKRNRNVGHI